MRLLGIDHPQQLILFHLIADVNRQRLQLPAHLGADVNLTQGVQLPRCQHALLKLSWTHDQRLVLRDRRIELPPSPDGDNQQE